jgi:hypothetical protein
MPGCAGSAGTSCPAGCTLLSSWLVTLGTVLSAAFIAGLAVGMGWCQKRRNK